jgi:hypothetical protein
MSKLKGFIKLFDIYGNYFQLRINNQTKFKTTSGGLLSIFTFIVLLLCMFNFGSDFLNKSNPKVILEEGLYQDQDIPVLNGTEYPHKPILFFLPKTYTNVMKPTIYRYVNSSLAIRTFMTECDPNYITENFNWDYKKAPFLSYYCYDLNSYNLSNTLPVLMSFENCRTMNTAALNDLTAKNLTCDKDSVLSLNTVFLNVMTKQIGFKPDIASPFIHKTIQYAMSFSSNFYSSVSIYWNQYLLNDDIGWLTESIDYKSDLSPGPEKYSNTFYPTPTFVPTFTLRFYLSDSYKKYHRTYQKLQDVLAALGGFMKLILTCLNLISFLIRNYLIDLYIIDEKFEIEKNINKPTTEMKTNNLENSQQSKLIFKF